MPDIVVSEFMDESVVAELARDYELLYDAALVDRRDELKAALAEARALIVRNRTRVDEALLQAAPRLTVIGRLGVGLDNIDGAACAARGVAVCPAMGANAVAVAEYVIGGLLVLRRGAYQASEQVLSGAWPRMALIGRELAGARLGLVGFGAISREVARRAFALGVRVAAHDPYLADEDPCWGEFGVTPCALDALLAESDMVSLHVPLTPETRHLIDAESLARMPTHALLVNTARGGIVDTAALAAALGAGRLGGALLDVFESEPLPAGAGLDGLPNLILTPHIAGLTEESQVRISRLTADNVRRALES
jgi:(S)-sulfolactate dehydrogenase